ncbi:UNVERIFIED_CONTAM: hypothetical protein FKN15_049319 [Acipenser sinensis]
MYPWLPLSYAWGNFTILAIAVWAIAQRDSIDAVLMVSLQISNLIRNMSGNERSFSCECSRGGWKSP